MTFQDPFHSTDLLERLMMPQEGSKTKIVFLGKPRLREQRGLLEVTDHVVLGQDSHRLSELSLPRHPCSFLTSAAASVTFQDCSALFVRVAVNGNVLARVVFGSLRAHWPSCRTRGFRVSVISLWDF